MPPGRSKKHRERLALASQIEQTGIEIPDCSNCSKHGRRCIVSIVSSRCAECVRHGLKCDAGVPSAGDWAAVERESSRLQKLEDEAMEAIMRLPRIKKQREFLMKRASDMLRRGMQNLDELDAAEEAEREAAERADAEKILSSSILTDPVLALPPGCLDEAFWVSLSSFDGIGQGAQSTAS